MAELTRAAVCMLMRDARLSIPDTALHVFSSSVGAVLAYVAVLQKVEPCEPVTHMMDHDTKHHGAMRADVVGVSLGLSLVNAAPLSEEGYFVLPAAIVHESTSVEHGKVK